MSGADRRLAKVEGALTPQQAILAYLDEVAAAPSFVLHQLADADRPLTGALVRLTQQVERATRQAHVKAPKEEIEQYAREAVRDVVFLHALIMDVNERILGEARLRDFQLLAINHELRAPLTALEGGLHRSLLTAAHVAPLVIECYASAQAVTVVATRYFAGREIRFPDVATLQTGQLAQVDEMLAIYAEAVALLAELVPGEKRQRGAPSPVAGFAPLDPAALCRQAEAPARDLAELMIALAKSEALRFIGARQQAWTQLARQLPALEDLPAWAVGEATR
jgi:hypothetical protein